MIARHVLLISAVVLVFRETAALKCFTCTNCDELGATESTQCKPKENKCIKMKLMNGETDRLCGDSKRCVGRDTRKTRAAPLRPEELTNDAPKQRTIRQLLASGGGGGGAKEADVGAKEISEMHCCGDDDCNSGRIVVTFGAILILPALVALAFLS